jgi:hypothetical protein
MGLDMYMNKVKKHPKHTPEEMIKIAYNEGYLMSREDYEDKAGIKHEASSKLFMDRYEPYAYKYVKHEWQGEITSLQKRVAYWRKANQIFAWIEENCGHVENGKIGSLRITKDHCEALLKDCEKAMTHKDKALSGDTMDLEMLMPTRDGFFFGDTEYDEYYFSDIEYTIQIMKEIIAETDWENETIFYEVS